MVVKPKPIQAIEAIVMDTKRTNNVVRMTYLVKRREGVKILGKVEVERKRERKRRGEREREREREKERERERHTHTITLPIQSPDPNELPVLELDLGWQLPDFASIGKSTGHVT